MSPCVMGEPAARAVAIERVALLCNLSMAAFQTPDQLCRALSARPTLVRMLHGIQLFLIFPNKVIDTEKLIILQMRGLFGKVRLLFII